MMHFQVWSNIQQGGFPTTKYILYLLGNILVLVMAMENILFVYQIEMENSFEVVFCEHAEDVLIYLEKLQTR